LDASRWLTHFYVQDDIKVTNKLTLNLGLRYELSNWFHHNEGRLSGYDTETGTYMWASTNPITNQPANAPRTLVDPDRNNFAPRFGFAYLLHPKTTVRGGMGSSTMPTSPGKLVQPAGIGPTQFRSRMKA
jgi:outer membrane receptor protein involved in Fe transport